MKSLKKIKSLKNLKISLILLWLVLTLSMAVWWMILILRLISNISTEGEVIRFQNMVVWEGLSWMALLLFGGISLLFYVIREQKQAQKFKAFVASFTHDLKTSLTSLKLQAESLKEDLGEGLHALASSSISGYGSFGASTRELSISSSWNHSETLL